MPKSEGRFTPTDAILEHFKWLQEYRASGGGYDETDLDKETWLFEAILMRHTKREIIGALNDVIFGFARFPLTGDDFEYLTLALNTTFGFKPDLLGDEPEE